MEYELKKHLKLNGLTMRQAAAQAGIGLSTLFKVSSNQNVEMRIIEKLLNLFDCEPSDFMTRSHSKR